MKFACRLVCKKTQPFLGDQIGLPLKSRVRNFINNHLTALIQSYEKHIKEIILASSSLVFDVFERKKLVPFLQAWFEYSVVPSSLVGAILCI